MRGGIAALQDQPRSLRPVEIDEIRVVAATLADGDGPPGYHPVVGPVHPPDNVMVLFVDELCDASHNSSDVKSSVM
jgi:hypothetical protein